MANDTLNGTVLNPSEITLSGVTVPAGLTLNNNGTVSVAPQLAAGTYNLVYQICEVLNPTNCDTATISITVSAAPIDAVDDDFSGNLFNGVVGGIIGDVTLNDTLNNELVTDNLITITLLDNDGIDGLTLEANGNMNIPAGSAEGTYLIEYQICEILNPTNCDQAFVTIIIGGCLDFEVNDCDGEGVSNGQEALDGTNPSDACDLNAANQDMIPTTAWLQADCDGDGVSNGQEIIDGTDPTTSCDYLTGSVNLPQGGNWNEVDCDGDGVINGTEVADGTNPLDPCEFVPANVTLPQSQEFLEDDCDGDGLTNGEEIGNDPTKPNDSNANGIPDFLEVNNHNPISEDGLEVFQFVTPNGDGDNDVFVIRGIENFPNNSVEIYNRWGVKVYGVQGYGQGNNFFRGISEGRATVNQPAELPVGTYYYVLTYVNAEGKTKDLSGYLYINR